MYSEEKEAAILTLLSEALDRIETLEKELATVKEKQTGERIFKALPQGSDSGLNADFLDGKHLKEVLYEADRQTRDFMRRIESKFRAVALSRHGNELHSTPYESLGACLLLNGTRAMTGDLDMGDGNVVTVSSGVYSYDISANPSQDAVNIYQHGTTTGKYVFCRGVKGVYWLSSGNCEFRTGQNAAQYLKIRSYTGAAWQDHLKFVGGAVTLESALDCNSQNLTSVGGATITGDNLEFNGSDATYDKIVFRGALLKVHKTSGDFYFRNVADTSVRALRFGRGYFQYLDGGYTTTYLDCYSNASAKVLFRANDGSDRVCASLHDGYFLVSPDGDTSGQAAAANLRGALKVVQGAGGARDILYVCLKSDSDTYSWVAIADGGA